MNELAKFQFQGNQVRTIEKDGAVWFVAKDVCDVLGLSKHRDAVARLDEDERGTVLVDTLGGAQEMAAVNESGVYKLIFKSRKKVAKEFTKWVTSEVLPAIRRTSGYIKTNPEDTPESIMARGLLIAKDTIDRQQALINEANNRIKELAPDAEYAQIVLSAGNLHTINEIAVHVGISAIKMNKFLESKGWIYRQGNNILPAIKIRGRELCDFHIVPYAYDSDGNIKTRAHLKWTEKGRKAIIDLWQFENPVNQPEKKQYYQQITLL